MTKSKVVVFWFRRDLRLDDNCALYNALSQDIPVLPVFIFDKNILNELEDRKDKRVNFIYSALQDIQSQLEQWGSSLLVHFDTPFDAFQKIFNEYDVQSVFFNSDYEPYAILRDRDIAELCRLNGTAYNIFKDHVIFEKNEVLKNDGLPYTVFTPYSRKWKENFKNTELHDYTSPKLDKGFLRYSSPFPEIEDLNFSPADLHLVKPEADFEIIKNYHLTRDFPALNKTTRLSVHLRFGTISVRKLAVNAIKLNEQFLNELIWREFFIQILYHFPNVVSREFNPKYRGFSWRMDEEDFKRWCNGETGFPLVDAGMKELNSTGFMHNRVRMVVANFLTKLLLINWQWGEAYFASKLLDYELASNNGNWQWAAGCGCDAAPYFRIFNPETQIERFDPDYEYIKKWIPNFDHENYIPPMVDYKFARSRALDFYKKALHLEKE
jgi:deoxyribodipyrimidine photo-lyase